MPVLDRPRYDGQAEWYDERNGPAAESAADAVRDLLGPVPGGASIWVAAPGTISPRSARPGGRSSAGLRIQRVVEPGEVEIPHALAILADKRGPT